LNRWLKIDDYQFQIESFGLRNKINTQRKINKEYLAIINCIAGSICLPDFVIQAD
jgi:hypothetical protein